MRTFPAVPRMPIRLFQQIVPASLAAKVWCIAIVVGGLFGLMHLAAGAVFALDGEYKRDVMRQLTDPRGAFGFAVRAGDAWTWSFADDQQEKAAGAVTLVSGALVELSRLVGVPFVRLRLALPEELFLGTGIAQSIGRRDGLAPNTLMKAIRAHEARMETLLVGKGRADPAETIKIARDLAQKRGAQQQTALAGMSGLGGLVGLAAAAAAAKRQAELGQPAPPQGAKAVQSTVALLLEARRLAAGGAPDQSMSRQPSAGDGSRMVTPTPGMGLSQSMRASSLRGGLSSNGSSFLGGSRLLTSSIPSSIGEDVAAASVGSDGRPLPPPRARSVRAESVAGSDVGSLRSGAGGSRRAGPTSSDLFAKTILAASAGARIPAPPRKARSLAQAQSFAAPAPVTAADAPAFIKSAAARAAWAKGAAKVQLDIIAAARAATPDSLSSAGVVENLPRPAPRRARSIAMGSGSDAGSVRSSRAGSVRGARASAAAAPGRHTPAKGEKRSTLEDTLHEADEEGSVGAPPPPRRAASALPGAAAPGKGMRKALSFSKRSGPRNDLEATLLDAANSNPAGSPLGTPSEEAEAPEAGARSAATLEGVEVTLVNDEALRRGSSLTQQLSSDDEPSRAQTTRTAKALWTKGVEAVTTKVSGEKPRYALNNTPSFNRRFSKDAPGGAGLPQLPAGVAPSPGASPQSFPLKTAGGVAASKKGAWQRAAARVAIGLKEGGDLEAAAKATPEQLEAAAAKLRVEAAAEAKAKADAEREAKQAAGGGGGLFGADGFFGSIRGSLRGKQQQQAGAPISKQQSKPLVGIADIVLAKAKAAPAPFGQSWQMLKEQSNVLKLTQAVHRSGDGETLFGSLLGSGRGNSKRAGPDPRFIGRPDDLFRPFDADAEGQFVGSAMVLALMHTSRLEPAAAIAQKQRDAAFFFREHCVLSHDFDSLVEYFRVLLSRHNMVLPGWRPRAQLWRLVLLQDVRGFWDPGAGLAQALNAVKLTPDDLKRFLSGEAADKASAAASGKLPTCCPLSGGDPEAFTWSIPAVLRDCAARAGGRLDAERVWATSLCLAALQAKEECWQDQGGFTVADRGFYWLEEQALAVHEFALVMGQVIREAKAAVDMWADYNDRVVKVVRDAERTNRFRWVEKRERFVTRLMVETLNGHDFLAALFAPTSDAIVRWQRVYIWTTGVLVMCVVTCAVVGKHALYRRRIEAVTCPLLSPSGAADPRPAAKPP